MTIRVGFLGAGLISRMHAAFLSTSSIPNTIAAVHDPDGSRAEAFAAASGAATMDEASLLDAVDAVYITTWTSEHERLVRAAAERRLPVFCEKPLAVSAASAERMVAAVEGAGVANQVGLILRFVPQFLLARELVRDDRAGRLMAVSFRDDQYIPNQGTYASTWRMDPAMAGRGTLLEHSIHDVDVLQWIGGRVESVSTVVREFHDHHLIDDVAAARLEFRGGAVASLTSVWHDILERPSMRLVEFFCERLHVVIDGGLEGGIRWQFTGEPGGALSGDDIVTACIERNCSPTPDVTTLLGRPVFNPATSFLGAVAGGHPSVLPLRDALVAHHLVDLMYESAAQGGVPLAGTRSNRDST